MNLTAITEPDADALRNGVGDMKEPAHRHGGHIAENARDDEMCIRDRPRPVPLRDLLGGIHHAGKNRLVDG